VTDRILGGRRVHAVAGLVDGGRLALEGFPGPSDVGYVAAIKQREVPVDVARQVLVLKAGALGFVVDLWEPLPDHVLNVVSHGNEQVHAPDHHQEDENIDDDQFGSSSQLAHESHSPTDTAYR
jgi:hypothetical protein